MEPGGWGFLVGWLYGEFVFWVFSGVSSVVVCLALCGLAIQGVGVRVFLAESIGFIMGCSVVVSTPHRVVSALCFLGSLSEIVVLGAPIGSVWRAI